MNPWLVQHGWEARTDDASAAGFGMRGMGKPGQQEQMVDIPVPQIVEKIAEVSKSLIVCSSILGPLLLRKSKCFRHELV